MYVAMLKSANVSVCVLHLEGGQRKERGSSNQHQWIVEDSNYKVSGHIRSEGGREMGKLTRRMKGWRKKE